MQHPRAGEGVHPKKFLLGTEPDRKTKHKGNTIHMCMMVHGPTHNFFFSVCVAGLLSEGRRLARMLPRTAPSKAEAPGLTLR